MNAAFIVIAILLSVAIVLLQMQMAKDNANNSKPRLIFAYSFNHIKIQGDNLMARIKDSQSITATLSPVSKKGNPAQVQAGTVRWESSDEAVATVEPDPENELSAKITPVGLGVAQITATADADLSEEGTVEITGTGAIEVVAGDATSFALSFGEPTETEA